MVFMIPVVIKNLFSRSATRPYPQSPPRPLFAGSRGQLINDADKCILCGVCVRTCPSQCLTVRRKGLWEYEPFACVFCGACVAACPTGSLSQLGQWHPAVRERERVVLEVIVPPKKH